MRKKLFFLIPSIGIIIFLTIFLTVSFSKEMFLLRDSDTGWHIRLGEFILDNFSIPSHDIYSYVTPPLPYIDADWLSEVIMALLHRNFGLTGVVIFFALLISLTYYLLFKIIRQYGGYIITDALIVLIVLASSMVHWVARPHIFSITLFLISYPKSDLESEIRSPFCYCEDLKGAWQSHWKRRDCFVSLAITIFYIGIWEQIQP